jgi:hypothetical protein
VSEVVLVVLVVIMVMFGQAAVGVGARVRVLQGWLVVLALVSARG